MSSVSIYNTFNEAVERAPDKTALIYLGKRFSYLQLKDLVEKLTYSLNELGVKRAVIYLPHCPQWVIAWLALMRIGAVAIPITPIYTARDVKYIVNDSSADAIFCTDINFRYVAQVLPETALKVVVVTSVVELLPWWKRYIGKALGRVPGGKTPRGKGIFTFKSLLSRGKGSLPFYVSAGGRDVAEILYTGGTTGLPKGVPISHVLFLQSIGEQRKVSEPLIPVGKDVVLLGAALYHILGQAIGIGALLHGDTVILLPRLNLDAVFDHIQRYKATTLVGVPALYRMILEHDRVDYYDLSSLKYCFCAGDVLPLEVADRWLKKFGIPIYQGYGATETYGGVALTPTDESRIPNGAVGKIVSFQEVMVVDPDTLEPVPPGETGELLVSSENMVTGYWNKPEETAVCFVNINGKLWYRTKDLVRIDKDGWLYFIDRSADMIKHKGYRVAPAKIEAVLQEHPAVVAAAVVGVPDPMVGERIKAFVVLKEDVRGVSAYELLSWCRERLAPYELPHYIEFRDMLPKSKVGKILRRELRDEERRRLEKAKVM
ncbi:MAG: AMP-binding protein [Candidatus Nezhaarchaeota archaeon]|nr:AMP-binding protein [Candidatus Nezhaarchaeota archaeon]